MNTRGVSNFIALARVKITFPVEPMGRPTDKVGFELEAPPGEESRYLNLAMEALLQRQPCSESDSGDSGAFVSGGSVEIIFLARPRGKRVDRIYFKVEAPPGQAERCKRLALEALRLRLGSSQGDDRGNSSLG